MKQLTLFTTFLIFTSSAFSQVKASSYDLNFPLSLREKFYTSFLETQQDANDLGKIDALKLWKTLKAKENPKFNSYVTGSLKGMIYSQSVIDWFSHYQMTGQYKKSAEVVSSYYYSLAAFIWEASNNPRSAGDSNETKLAQNISTTAFQAVQKVETCLYKVTPTAGKELNSLATVINTCVNSTPEVAKIIQAATQLMNVSRYAGPNQVLSLTGFIPGNKIEQLTQNHDDAEFIRYLAPLTALVQKNYSTLSVEDFKLKMPSKAAALANVFTASEGFPARPSDHRNWTLLKKNNKKNTYGSIFNAIENAKEAIFIDVFFLGGSIGASLAKQLIEQVQKKPDLTVYIINDRFNPFTYENEMAPVYNYLRAYSEKFPEDRLVIMTPRIDLKRTAFPPIAENIINDQTLKYILTDKSQSDLKGQLGFYPKGKSDHSKIIIVDGKNKTSGIAFVGSKNFTDSSGGISYDEVTKIQGPAVPAILDSYYYDLFEAFKELQRLSPAYYSQLATKNGVVAGSDANTSARQLLAKFDVMNRYKGKANLDLQWPAQGSGTISIGENNVYGTIRSALPQDIDLINSAEKQIIISDQFLYDPLVVRALLEKIQKSQQLKVYIMLATLSDVLAPARQFAHIPNISYIDSLKATGQVAAKWKKVPSANVEAIKEAFTKHNVKLSPEYHLKAISIDGVTPDQAALCNDQQKNYPALANSMTKLPAMVSGSANKDVMTLTGGFREFQVVVYDRAATIAHDCQFWERFNDSNESSEISSDTMNLPPELTSKGIDAKQFNQLIRNIITISYGAMTGYFAN